MRPAIRRPASSESTRWCRARAWPGKCVPHGNGCQTCVPTCDIDGDGVCPQVEPGNEQPGGDCDDANARVFPDAVELCGNAKDDDCDGLIDDNCAATTCSTSATCGANATCSTGR